MGKLIQLTAKLKQLTPERMTRETLEIVQSHEQTATNMITDQLHQGQDSKGQNLPDYSERSVQVFGKDPGPMRLFETGAYYRSIFMDASKFPVVFGATDQKEGKIADMLAAKGAEIQDNYGLQKQNLTDFARSYVLPDLQNFIRDFIRV